MRTVASSADALWSALREASPESVHIVGLWSAVREYSRMGACHSGSGGCVRSCYGYDMTLEERSGSDSAKWEK